MCDVTLLGSAPTPDPAEEGALPQSRGLEGTPHSCCLLPPISALFLPEGKTGWTLGPLPAAGPHALDTAAEWLRLCAH